MTYATVASGIEGFGLGFEGAGMTPLWQCDIDKPCESVRRRHWPNIPHYRDMVDDVLARAGEIVRPDVLAAGTPCQAFSVAGNRRSLDDARGNLTLAFAAICDALDPTWIVWENVFGVLSTSDNAFGCLLGQLVGGVGPLPPDRDGSWGSAGMVAGPRRVVGWRVLNSQHFGVAQRRRRVYVVGHVLAPAGPMGFSQLRERERVLGLVSHVLFESDGVRRDCAPHREAGAKYPSATRIRAEGGREHGPGGLGGLSEGIADCLTGSGGGADVKHAQAHQIVSRPLLAKSNASYDESMETYVTHTLRGEGFDASEDGTGRGTPLVAFGWNKSSSGGRDRLVVRRLTPTECARLQGFPDDWNRWDAGGKQLADSPRYRQFGNAVTCNVAAWIGNRIVAAEALA